MTFSCATAGKASSTAASNPSTLMKPPGCSYPVAGSDYCIVQSMQATSVGDVGSRLRPAYRKDAFRRFAQRELEIEALRAAEDRAVREVARRQESIGLPVVTDGEYRRLNWQVSFSEVEG